MHASMPPDSLPPDDAREPDLHDANVVDPEVLAERRAQRAETAERSATRRAADAQSLAADLARERARLEAERDAARAEAAAAREGADAVKAEARHLQAERDALRAQVEKGETEREALRAELEHVRGEAAHSQTANGTPSPNGNGNGEAPAPAAPWATGLRREIAVARASAARPSPAVLPAPGPAPSSATLGRERDLVARHVGGMPATAIVHPRPGGSGERATPLTALALERERSNRLRARLEQAVTIEKELRAQVNALEHAVRERRDAERRIEAALQRVRIEFDVARRLEIERAASAEQQPSSAPLPAADAEAVGGDARRDRADLAAHATDAAPGTAEPAPPATAVEPPIADVGEAAGPGLDAERLDAAQARLRAAAEVEVTSTTEGPVPPMPPTGPPSPWIAAALRRLMRDDPATAGRLIVAMLPAQGLVTQRALHYDLVLKGRGCVGVDVGDEGTVVARREQSRARREVDFRITTDEEGLARLLLARRRRRRGTRVRGSRRRVRELRRLVADPLALRDLASAGAMLDPQLALMLVALAIDPSATYGHRFTIAHAPLAGGPADAWLRIQNGGPPAVLRTRPGETPVATIRCTRGALLPTLAGLAAPRGEAVAIDGDGDAVALLRAWIARTEFPDGR